MSIQKNRQKQVIRQNQGWRQIKGRQNQGWRQTRTTQIQGLHQVRTGQRQMRGQMRGQIRGQVRTQIKGLSQIKIGQKQGFKQIRGKQIQGWNQLSGWREFKGKQIQGWRQRYQIYQAAMQNLGHVYSYSSQQSRRVQFHLRVLIKGLLQQLLKIKQKFGLDLQIDQGLMGMCREQIIDFIDIQDILRVFRSVPKIVQVEKVIQKVVDRVIQIPQIVPVQVLKEIPVEVTKYEEIEKVVHVPVDVIQVVDRVVQKLVPIETRVEVPVQVPRLVQVLHQSVIQVPKLIEKVVVQQKVVEVIKQVQIQKIIHVPVIQKQIVEVIRQKVVPVETKIEIPYPVQAIVQKAVPVKQTISVPVQVQKNIDRPIIDTEVLIAREVVNHIQQRVKVVNVEKEKLVKFNQHHQVLVPTTQVIEKIVQVRTTVPQIHEVQVIVQKIVQVQKPVYVQKIVEKPVYMQKVQLKYVDKVVQVPVVTQKIRVIPQQITQVVVEKVQIQKPYQVICQVGFPIQKTKVVQIQKPVVHYIYEQVPVQMKVDKIVPVTKTVQRIKQVRVCIDKLVQKMVEVPKVVQVQKIVEKVVVVPRVIQKIVEVPQIVQVCVDRVIQTQRIVQVPTNIQVPIVKQKQKPIEVQKVIYVSNDTCQTIQVQKMAEKVIRQSNVQVMKIPQKIVQIEKIKQPVQIIRDRMIPQIQKIPQTVVLLQDKIIEVKQLQVVDRISQKSVCVPQIQQKIVQVPQVIKVPVPTKHTVQVQKIVNLTQQILQVQQKYTVVQDKIPYIQTKHQIQKCFVQKPIYMTNRQQIIKPVQVFSQKLANQVHKIQQPLEVKCIQQVPIQQVKLQVKTNQIPLIVKQPYIVKQFRDVLVQVPIVCQQVQPVQILQQKIVAVKTTQPGQIIQVPKIQQKVVRERQIDIRTDTRNFIQKTFETVNFYSQKPISTTNIIEKVVQVPHIIQKIVQKIVVMPQIVQILKYVHQIIQQDNIAVGVDVKTQQIKFKQLYGKVKGNFQPLLLQLNKLKLSHPTIKAQIVIIQSFLAQLNSLLVLPRIVQMQSKGSSLQLGQGKAVLVPNMDFKYQRHQVTLSLIVHKLMAQLLRLKENNPNINMSFDVNILNVFGSDFKYKELFEGKGSFDINGSIDVLYKQYDQILKSIGGSSLSREQQQRLNLALQQRLIMGTVVKQANYQIGKIKDITKQKEQAFNKVNQSYQNLLLKMGGLYDNSSMSKDEMLKLVLSYITEHKALSSTNNLQQFILEENFLRMDSAFRQIIDENSLLRRKLIQTIRYGQYEEAVRDRDRIIQTIQKRNTQLVSELSTLRAQSSVSVNVTANTHQYQIRIRTLNSKIQQLQSQLRTVKIDYQGKMRAKDSRIRQLQESIKIGDSRITEMGGTRYSASNYSGNQKLSSSQHSHSSGTNSQTPSKTPSSQTALSGKQYVGTGTGLRGDNPSSSGVYSATGARVIGATQSSSSISYGRGQGNVTYGANQGGLSGSSGNVSGTGNVTYGTGSGTGYSGTGYQRTYGQTGGLNQSGSSQGSVSYGGRQYTGQTGQSNLNQPGQSGSSTGQSKYYSTSSSYHRQNQN